MSLLKRWKKSFSVLVVFFCLSVALPQSAFAKRICVKSSGEIVTKRRCRTARGEQELSASTIASFGSGVMGARGEPGPQGPEGPRGPIGPQGVPGSVNFDSCYKRSFSNDALFFGGNIVEASCDNPSTEFVLSDTFFTDDYQASLRSRFPRYDGPDAKLLTGIAYVASRENFANLTPFELTVELVCCDRE